MDEEKKYSNTTAYLIFAILLVIGAGGSYYLGRYSVKPQVITQQPSPGNFQRPSGPPSMKGQKLSDVQMLSSAVLIYPGVSDADVQKALINWELKTKVLADGTTQADLIPVGSEATEGDTTHTFILKPGDKLYFDDLNPNDDKPGMDENTHDDLGIMVDASGVIQ